ncbi:MAG: PAS domain-containing protein [Bacteroidetes bacterium]|nr:PAS domain-containing protein [Bacteroidota bacterium]
MPRTLLANLKNRLNNIGNGYPGLNADERSRLKLIHLFLLAAVAFSATTGLVFAAFGDYAVTWLCSLGVSIQLGELLLIKRRQYGLIKHLFAVMFPVYMVLNVALTGTFSMIGMLALPFVTLTMFLFRQPGIRALYVVVYTAALVLSFLAQQFIVPVYPVANAELINTIGIFLALALEVFFLNLYIDEMRRNSLALARSERQYHTLFEKAPFPLILYANGGIVDCNEAGLRIMGAERKSQLIGRMPSDFSPEMQANGRPSSEAREGLDELIRQKGTHRFEWTHRDFQGRDFPVEITMAAIHDDLMFGMWSDLSVRKKDEARIHGLLDSLRARKRELESTLEELSRQRAFYEDILNGLPADVAVFDKDHRYLFLNPVAVNNPDMRRWLIGRTDFDYAQKKGLPTDTARKRHSLFQRVLNSGHSMHWEDRTAIDGKLQVILRRLSPVYVNGQVQFVVGYGTDITKIKEAEAIIKDHNAVLQSQVERRTLELQQAVKELRRSNADLESFAYAASHDLQEPLRMITSFLQMIRRTQGGRLDEAGHEYIDFALNGVGRLTGLIKALLSYSRLDQQDFQLQQADSEALVRDRIADLSALIAERGAEVHFRSLPPTLCCEPVMLGMVFYNIIGNAIKFNRNERPEVSIWAEESAEHWTFFIRDNGIGIPADKKAVIFEPFKRLHSVQEFAGTGVGLASCRKIIERHGGEIDLDSEIGQGTTFYFKLPKTIPADNPEAATSIKQTQSLPPAKSAGSAPSSSQSFPLLTPRRLD